MTEHQIITITVQFVRNELKEAEAGHDWWHVYRVWQNAKEILKHEVNVNQLVVELGALLHDIADSKFHHGDDEIGPQKAGVFLRSLNSLSETDIDHIISIIRCISFRSEISKNPFESRELWIVRDADRLDAIGAIGIARAFHFGGYKNRLMFDPKVLPQLKMTKEEYKKNKGPTINHFYEKLFKLKDLMHTIHGRKLAEGRHQFMQDYLTQFYLEWGDTQDFLKRI